MVQRRVDCVRLDYCLAPAALNELVVLLSSLGLHPGCDPESCRRRSSPTIRLTPSRSLASQERRAVQRQRWEGPEPTRHPENAWTGHRAAPHITRAP